MSLSGWNGLFYSFLRCEENGTGLPECTSLEYVGGALAIAGGHQTLLESLLEGFKTLNCEKKPWEASLSGMFGCGRSILAPQSESDTATCENACAVCCFGSIYFGWVVSDFTK